MRPLKTPTTTLLAALASIAALLGAAGVARADAVRPVLVELFTSQGCSSCPPADKLFETYARRADLVALSYAVDYWDYLGWKDTLASPKFTKRQREYAANAPGGQVYTPQMVVEGQAHAVGSDRAKIDTMIEQARATTTSAVKIDARVDGSTFVIDVGAGEPRSVQVPVGQAAVVWMAVVQPVVEVTVTRGENKGRTLKYHNVVRDVLPVGKWTGDPISVRLDRSSVMSQPSDRCAVFLQAGKGGPVLAAAWMP